jgi:hypothetical protein
MSKKSRSTQFARRTQTPGKFVEGSWKVGTVAELLGLSAAEEVLAEARLVLKASGSAARPNLSQRPT